MLVQQVHKVFTVAVTSSTIEFTVRAPMQRLGIIP